MSTIQISIITSLYRSEVFLKDFLRHVSAISNPEECELIIIHNDASAAEKDMLGNYQPGKLSVVHVMVKREGLYSSWNRAVKLAKGKYMAVWNVDDIRTPDSLQLQKEALDGSTAVMCYGDFYGASQYGEHKEVLYEYDTDFTSFRGQALRRHIVGCFPMWKKAIHHSIGYFDEQFRLVADFEFQIRTILNYDLVKCNGFTGYHLIDLPHKLSSNRFLQQKEQTVVKLRYQLYNQILIHLLPFIYPYKIYRYLNFQQWHKLTDVIPQPLLFTGKLLMLISMPVVYTVWVIKKVFTKSYRAFQHLLFPVRLSTKRSV